MTRAVNIAWRSARSVQSVQGFVTGPLADSLRRAGYQLQSTTDTANPAGPPGTEWIYLRESRSPYYLLGSWLLWWLVKDRAWVVISLAALADGRTELLVAGDLPGRIAALLRELAAPVSPAQDQPVGPGAGSLVGGSLRPGAQQ